MDREAPALRKGEITMNEYKITYSGESEGYRIITDRTEAAAKKFFREDAKELGLGRIAIDSVELVSTNAMATKRNERETLEVIRQLVADLGPQSYLATAFEGCFEIAEQNIEYDFGDSMKGRVESAERKVEGLEAEIKSLKDQLAESEKDYEAAHAANHELAEQKDAEIAALQAQILGPDDMEDVRQLLSDRADEAEEKALKAADEIVKYAEAPTSKEFQEAVRMHRNYIRDVEYTRDLLGRVVAAQAAYHAGA